ncbi:MAG TPA: flagellar hook-associated protein FlgK [Pirellulaceae bacterium]|nr:flagellar hook-associated protein FlgK [Pirellulaceae bacterium]
MSLFSSIQTASNTLQAMQLGIQVAGNNIANANTPGYMRQSIVLQPASTQKKGNLLLGLGVDVSAVIQQSDKFLEERLRGAISDLSNGETQEGTYAQLETILGELSDTDLSTQLTKFFGSINDILNQPESIPVRNLAVLQGKTLANDVKSLHNRVLAVRNDVNDQIINSATDINRLLGEISKLNKQIISAEGGDVSKSDAVGLRDQRNNALEDLAKIIDVKVVEQKSGDVTVFAGGEYLVFEGTFRKVVAELTPDRGINSAQIKLEATDAPLNVSSGKLSGLIQSRDQVLGGFLDQLNEFSRTLSYEFNKIYSSGQGLVGYTDLTSEFTVDGAQLPLDQAGLKYTPVNGSFQVQVLNKQTGLTNTFDIPIRLNGLDDDTTLDSLQQQLDAIDGLKAEITPTRGLRLSTESANLQFAFANDTSGTLASLGLATFFTGSSAGDMGVSKIVSGDPAKFAVSSSGIGKDTDNAVALASFLNRPLESESGASISDMYDRMAGDVTQQASVAKAVAEGFRVFQRTLDGQRLAISGVNIDEEAVHLMTYQRSYQAAARYISVVNQLLETLVNL